MASTVGLRTVSREHSHDSGNESLKECKDRPKNRIELSNIASESFLSSEATRYAEDTGGNSETLYIISSHVNENKSSHGPITSPPPSKDLESPKHGDNECAQDGSLDIPHDVLVLPHDESDPISDFSVHACDQTKIIEPPPQPPVKVYPHYPEQSAKWSGLCQLGLGVVSVACQGVAIHFSEPTEYEKDGYNYFSTGIWCGVCFFLTGVVCLFTVSYKTRKVINSNLILSGLSCGLFSLCLFAMSCISLYFIQTTERYSCDQGSNGSECPTSRPLLIMHITLLVTAVLEFLVSLKMAIHSYKTLYKDSTTLDGSKPTKSLHSKLDNGGLINSPGNHRDVLYQAGMNSPRRSDTTSVSSHRSRSLAASRASTTDGASNEGYEADDSFGTLNSMSSHWSTLTKSDHDIREDSSLTNGATHRRTSSHGSFSSVESNCVVIKLPEHFDKIISLGEVVPKRPYYNSNEDTDFGTGKTLLGDCSNSDVLSNGRSATDSAYDEMSEDSVSSPEYPRIIVKYDEIPDTIFVSGPIRL